MFERELIDGCYVQRWSIVRTLMPQSIAEHTFLVTHYANDIALFLDINRNVHLCILQKAIWHDVKDEVFTGDLPGPNKRGLLDAIGPGAKAAWNAKLVEWAKRTFKNLVNREGGDGSHPAADVMELVLKTADWLEAATRMATETQMGNGCSERHVMPNMNGALETAKKLCQMYYDEAVVTDGQNQASVMYFKLAERIGNAVFSAHHGQSVGPWITKEDEGRTYYDACVDSTEQN